MIYSKSPVGLGCLLVVAQLSGCASIVTMPSAFLTSSASSTSGHSANGQPTQSPAIAEAAGSLPPKQAAEACLATAKQLHAHGDAKEAILLYERARQLNPNERRVSRYLALLYDQEGNDARALAEYRKAVEVSPRDADLLNDLGYYFYRRRNWPQAEAQFRSAIAVAPEHERAWVNLGLVLGEEGRYQESFNAFAKMLGPAAAHSNVGVILAAHQQNAQAKIAFQNALALQPQLPQPNAFLSHLSQLQPATVVQTAKGAGGPDIAQ